MPFSLHGFPAPFQRRFPARPHRVSSPGIPCRRSCDFQGSMKACRKHITMKQKYLGSIPSGFQWILGGSQGKTGSNRSGLMWYWMNQRWFFWNEFFSKNMLIQRPLRCETSAFLCWTSGLGEAQQVFWSWICKKSGSKLARWYRLALLAAIANSKTSWAKK